MPDNMETNKNDIQREIDDRTPIEHYRRTGRTPLSVPFLQKYTHHDFNDMEMQWDMKYKRFEALLSDADVSEYTKLIDRSIEQFQRIIKRNDNHVVSVYFQKLIADLELKKDRNLMKWEKFRSELISNGFIPSTVSKELFFEVMVNHRLLPNEDKIKPGENLLKGMAVYMNDEFNFPNLGVFMKCFDIELVPGNRTTAVKEKKSQSQRSFERICDLAPKKA